MIHKAPNHNTSPQILAGSFKIIACDSEPYNISSKWYYRKD